MSTAPLWTSGAMAQAMRASVNGSDGVLVPMMTADERAAKHKASVEKMQNLNFIMVRAFTARRKRHKRGDA